jgi:hypothetical protein
VVETEIGGSLYETPEKISEFFGVLVDTPITLSPVLDNAERKFFLFPLLFVFPVRLSDSVPNNIPGSELNIVH